MRGNSAPPPPPPHGRGAYAAVPPWSYYAPPPPPPPPAQIAPATTAPIGVAGAGAGAPPMQMGAPTPAHAHAHVPMYYHAVYGANPHNNVVVPHVLPQPQHAPMPPPYMLVPTPTPTPMPMCYPAPTHRGRGRGRAHTRARARGRGRGGTRGRGRPRVQFTPPAIPCRYFARGRCTNGRGCRFSHVHRAVCAAFLNGDCALGPKAACPHGAHVLTTLNTPDCERHAAGVCHMVAHQCALRHAESVTEVCVSFLKFGICIDGLDCPKAHTEYCRHVDKNGDCPINGCKLLHLSVVKRVRSQANVWKTQAHFIRVSKEQSGELEEGEFDEGEFEATTFARVEENTPEDEQMTKDEVKMENVYIDRRGDDSYMQHVADDNDEQQQVGNSRMVTASASDAPWNSVMDDDDDDERDVNKMQGAATEVMDETQKAEFNDDKEMPVKTPTPVVVVQEETEVKTHDCDKAEENMEMMEEEGSSGELEELSEGEVEKIEKARELYAKARANVGSTAEAKPDATDDGLAEAEVPRLVVDTIEFVDLTVGEEGEDVEVSRS